MRFVCKECNYSFESKINQEGKPCSYCGERKVIAEQDAEELLKEAE